MPSQVDTKIVRKVGCIESSRFFPVLGIATDFGNLLLMNYKDNIGLILLAEYFICSSKICSIFFTANFVLAVDVDNDLFLIHTKSYNNQDIKKLIQLDRSFIDLSMIEINKRIHLMILSEPLLPKSEIRVPKDYSNCVVYILIELECQYSHKTTNITLIHPYTSMKFQHTDSNSCALGVKFDGSEIDLIRINQTSNEEIEFAVQTEIKTMHSGSKIEIFISDESVLTFGMDGFITLLDKKSMEMTKSMSVYHSYSNGVKKAVMDSMQRWANQSPTSLYSNKLFSFIFRYIVTLGHNNNLICVQNEGASIEFLWINAQFSGSDLNIEKVVFEENIIAKTWKDIEMERLEDEEYQSYQQELGAIGHDLSQIKETVSLYIAANEREPIDGRFSIQFFNLDVIETQRQIDMAQMDFEKERVSLETQYANEKQCIDKIKKFTWDCYNVKPLKLRDIFTKIYAQNYPLTHLDERISNLKGEKLAKTPELVNRICTLKPWKRKNLLDVEEIPWPDNFNIKSDSFLRNAERFSAMASKVIDQQLNTKVKWSYDFIGLMSSYHETISVDDEFQVNVHNIKVYVSRTNIWK